MPSGELKGIARGKLTEEIMLPQGVTASLTGRVLAMKGPKGETYKDIAEPNVAITVESGKVILATGRDSKLEKKLL